MNNKILGNTVFKTAFIFAVMSALLFSSCGSKNKEIAETSASSGYEPQVVYDSYEESKSESADYSDDTESTGSGNLGNDIASDSLNKENTSDKLIIRNNLYIETKNFDKYISAIENMLIKEGGYIEQQNIYYGYEGRNETKSASYVMRVKKENMLSFEKGIENSDANIVRKEKTVENMTKEYADLDRRVKIIKAKEDRLIELMKKADKIKDLIEIEKELAQLVESRELLSSRMILIDHDVSYVYYNIDISEVKEYKEVKATNNNFASDLAYAFKSSITGFVIFIKNFILFLAYNWLIILILVIIAVLIRKFIIKYKDKRLFKKNKTGIIDKKEE